MMTNSHYQDEDQNYDENYIYILKIIVINFEVL